MKKIETANLNGTERRILLEDSNSIYIAFILHAGYIYFTDWNSRYCMCVSYCYTVIKNAELSLAESGSCDR